MVVESEDYLDLEEDEKESFSDRLYIWVNHRGELVHSEAGYLEDSREPNRITLEFEYNSNYKLLNSETWNDLILNAPTVNYFRLRALSECKEFGGFFSELESEDANFV